MKLAAGKLSFKLTRQITPDERMKVCKSKTLSIRPEPNDKIQLWTYLFVPRCYRLFVPSVSDTNPKALKVYVTRHFLCSRLKIHENFSPERKKTFWMKEAIRLYYSVYLSRKHLQTLAGFQPLNVSCLVCSTL